VKIDIEKLVKKYGSNYDLGKEVRKLYWHEKDLQRDRI
tara:strand:- start:327 stop:440 length:114 start_codon:yes stop_codon:yes gene_type:complete